MKNKLTVVLISFVFLISSVSGIFSAEEITEYDDQVVYAAENPEEISDLTEIPEKKERFTNHYLKLDGSYLAVMYTEPVNYYTNGKWEEIDNSLVNALDRDSAKVLRNKSNDYIVEFAEDAQSGKLVNIKADSYELSWSISSGMKDLTAQKAVIVKSTKTSSIIRYASAFQDVDIKYTVSSTRVREDIVLNSPAAASEFQFNITCENLTAKLEDDNSVSFIDPENPGEVVFTMEAPFMYDSTESSDLSYDIEVVLTKTKSGYSLVYSPDIEWLNSPKRVYPVVIDPTASIYSTRSSSAIADTYVHSGDAPGNHTTLSYLRVGNAPDGLTRTFVKTDLPAITDGTVFSAKLLLSNTSGSSTFQNIDVYRMDTGWTSSGVYWGNHETLTKTLVASNIPVTAYANSPSAHRYVCDVTDTVQDFYKGTRVNNGFQIRYTDEDYTDYNAFYLSDCGTANVMPCLYISYVYGQTSGISNGGIYYLKNKNSGMYLDVTGAGTANGTNVIQYNFHGLANQRWKAVYYGNGSFRILSECSYLTKGLTVEGASTQSGANVFQYTYTGSGSDDNDDWIFEGYYSVPQCLIPQQMDKWCWAASAEMLAKIQDVNFTRTQRNAVDHIFPPILGESWNIGGTCGQQEDAAEFITNDTIDFTHYDNQIYSEETIVQLIRAGYPIGISRGYYDGLLGGRTGGHATVIYRYYYNSIYDDMVFHILDPWQVNNGDIYPMSYSEIVSEGTTQWDGIVVRNVSIANNVIYMP